MDFSKLGKLDPEKKPLLDGIGQSPLDPEEKTLPDGIGQSAVNPEGTVSAYEKLCKELHSEQAEPRNFSAVERSAKAAKCMNSCIHRSTLDRRVFFSLPHT